MRPLYNSRRSKSFTRNVIRVPNYDREVNNIYIDTKADTNTNTHMEKVLTLG